MKSKLVKEKLHLEFVSKSAASSISFIVISIGLLIAPLLDQNNPLGFYNATLYLVIVINATRLWLSKKITSASLSKDHNLARNHLNLIIANTIAFGLIYCLSFWYLKIDSPKFTIIFIVYSGIAAGSVTSLSLYPIAQKNYIFNSMFIPFLIIVTRAIYTQNVLLYGLSVLMLAFLFFITKGSISVYKSVFKMFQLEEELTEEKAKLEESISEIFSQKVRTDYFTKLAAIGEMTRGLAHELNNPLTIIRGSNDRMEKIINNLKNEDEKKN